MFPVERCRLIVTLLYDEASALHGVGFYTSQSSHCSYPLSSSFTGLPRHCRSLASVHLEQFPVLLRRRRRRGYRTTKSVVGLDGCWIFGRPINQKLLSSCYCGIRKSAPLLGRLVSSMLTSTMPTTTQWSCSTRRTGTITPTGSDYVRSPTLGCTSRFDVYHRVWWCFYKHSVINTVSYPIQRPGAIVF